MAGRINTCSISFCFIFCFCLIFDGESRRNGAEIIPWNDISAYFVCQTVIASRFSGNRLRAGHGGRHFDTWSAAYQGCKREPHLHRTGLATTSSSGSFWSYLLSPLFYVLFYDYVLLNPAILS